MQRIVAASALVLALSMALAQPASSDPDFVWAEQGQSVYTRSCAGCHGAEGAGIAGVFPPLAGHIPELLALEGGANYLIHTIVYGLQGPIEVDGVAYDGSMPSWNGLSEADIAAVLNHIAVSWGNDETLRAGTVLFAPADVAAVRGQERTAADVLALRADVVGTELAGPSEPMVILNDTVGYFTAAQAAAGQGLYQQHCAKCHGDSMRGGPHEPPLTQRAFFRNWGGQTFDALLAYYSTSMPFGQSTRLNESQYVAIGAYWLQFHGYPSGDIELTADPALMRQILIERR